ncbi:MAG: hypothetical protein ACFCVK_26210 [Acidimicrobiales bacterium]
MIKMPWAFLFYADPDALPGTVPAPDPAAAGPADVAATVLATRSALTDLGFEVIDHDPGSGRFGCSWAGRFVEVRLHHGDEFLRVTVELCYVDWVSLACPRENEVGNGRASTGHLRQLVEAFVEVADGLGCRLAVKPERHVGDDETWDTVAADYDALLDAPDGWALVDAPVDIGYAADEWLGRPWPLWPAVDRAGVGTDIAPDDGFGGALGHGLGGLGDGLDGGGAGGEVFGGFAGFRTERAMVWFAHHVPPVFPLPTWPAAHVFRAPAAEERWLERWWGLWEQVHYRRTGRCDLRPRLADYVDDTVPRPIRQVLAHYLELCPLVLHPVDELDAWSTCWLCGEPLLTYQMHSDGTWLWPGDLWHQVLEHHMVVPNELAAAILARRGAHPERCPVTHEELSWPPVFANMPAPWTAFPGVHRWPPWIEPDA